MLDEFKGQFDSFDESTPLDADQQATFEGLEAAFAEADTAYDLASVQQQKENAAEVAKAKDAERAALLIARAQTEVERGLAV